jgi:hypothetical protein
VAQREVVLIRVRCRAARREDLGLTKAEFALLQRLSTPQKIQAYVNTIPTNHEIGGETIHSVRSVIHHRRAHCIEGAMFAACALWVHGDAPLVMRLNCADSDYPHVVALFRRSTGWGAISKTNGAVLRYRDPIYRSLRELALSYFHEYADKHGRKTLRSYTRAFDMRRFSVERWVVNGNDCQEVEDTLSRLPSSPLVSVQQRRVLTRLDPFQRKSFKLVQYPRAAGR